MTARLVSSVGPYALDMDIDHLEGLSELSYVEYLAVPKAFADERIYTAPDIVFLGFKWNLALAVKGGRIYKISPQILTRDSTEAERVFVASHRYFVDAMAEPTERDARRLIWRMTPGNIILEQAQHLGVHCVQFFITGGEYFVQTTLPTGQKELSNAFSGGVLHRSLRRLVARLMR